MTVSATVSKVAYAGDGATTTFAITFPYVDKTAGTDVLVYVIDNNGNLTLLTSNYTVDVNLNNVSYPTVGGVAPLGVGVNALPATWNIVIVRVETITQAMTLTNNGTWDGPTIEKAFDRLTYIAQQLQEQINRCVKYPINLVPAGSDINAAITALGALFPNLTSGTYAALKGQAQASPTIQKWGWATDQGTAGQMYFYCGNTAVGDQGWFGPLFGA